jgi:DNA-binding GntR family transcriptional regulator
MKVVTRMEKISTLSAENAVPSGNPLPMQIAEWLAERILNGELAAGARLKEEELAALFRTSRAPVREALYLLQLDGLVERLPRRGTVVRAYSEEDIRDLYEARCTLELSTIERLRTRWTDDTRRAFEEVLATMHEAVNKGDSHAYSQCNTHFHDILFQYAGSKILHRLYQQLGHPLQYLLESSTQSITQMKASYDEHCAIVQLLNNGEFDRAKEVLSNNVRHGMSRVIELRRQRISDRQAKRPH